MLNAKQRTITNDLDLIVFHFLTRWLDSKLQSFPVYLEFIEFTESLKKRIYSKSQLVDKNKWIRKFVRVNKLIQEFDNHDYIKHRPHFPFQWSAPTIHRSFLLIHFMATKRTLNHPRTPFPSTIVFQLLHPWTPFPFIRNFSIISSHFTCLNIYSVVCHL